MDVKAVTLKILIMIHINIQAYYWYYYGRLFGLYPAGVQASSYSVAYIPSKSLHASNRRLSSAK